ncbi:transmembrane-type terpene cyclase [Anaeromicrobium sediminis]|uniref:Uncharacterized protein n=1 Tax=Anaeromicrobium sediminis TaxID=1478221 RepID=A0A267MHQ6_9FIRM|nr:hypothetical protein [Anaeromicrobium sediminis]PAB59111.1 hypothetical protein CCE28_11375 [Anaeromicrobium sediminis]
MGNRHMIELILQLGMALFWTITYILIIRKGFKDRAHGMPMVALCANICWEFIFSFIYPAEGIQLIVNIVWFSLDCVIVLQFFIFGWKEFKKYTPLRYFYPTFIFGLILSFFIIVAISREFNDFRGKYAAFSQNFIMSALFISLILKRGNLKGQSLYIGICKMVGSLCASIIAFAYYRSPLVMVLATSIFLLDLIYIGCLCKVSSKNKTSTWTNT